MNVNKKFIYYFIAIVIIGALPKTAQVLRTHFTPHIQETTQVCDTDAKVCPDNTTVTRILPRCEFAACPISIQNEKELSTTTEVTAVPTPTIPSTQKELPQTKETVQAPVTFVSKIITAVTTVVSTITAPFSAAPAAQPMAQNSAAIPPSTYITSSSSQTVTSVYAPLPPADFAGQKYLVEGNNILSNDNKVIYTIPAEIITQVSSPNEGWTSTTISVIPVGTVAPILNAIPVKDLPGKYYLSENSFGNIEACEFSNKIFILDTVANTVTLMYEENSSTLSHDDPRACNSEIFLLATEGSKLVIKYHTIGTNTLCDSAWSEPDKTFYLDVTKLQTQGMMRYDIPTHLTETAEQEEEACRTGL
jgi:hypothetical protein